MNIHEAKAWAGMDETIRSNASVSTKEFRSLLIRCARLAIAERKRANELAEERNRALEEAAHQTAVAGELRRTLAGNPGEPARPGYSWCGECGCEVHPLDVDQHVGCLGRCNRTEPSREPDDPAPIGSVWEYTEGVCKGHRYRKEADGYRYINPDGGHCPRLDSAFDPPTDPKFRRVDDQPRPEPAAQHCAQPTSAGAAAWEERLRISRWFDINGGGLIASLIRGGEHWREDGETP